MPREALVEALSLAGLCSTIESAQSLSGGCIHDVRLLRLADGGKIVAKIADAASLSLFEQELAGLQALAETRTVHVPRPFIATAVAGKAVLLMDALEPATADVDTWQRFGRDLANLHQTPVGDRFGFETDNHLGTTSQPNDWCDDWVQFTAEHRLGHQLRLLESRGVLQRDERDRLRQVIQKLDQLIPAKPRPSLLHGDLWSGNAMAALVGSGETRIAMIDPACFIGDGWADIAMMKLFGGFPEACYAAYWESVDDHEQLETRIAVYQLYHVLNHVTIFGRSYVPQAMALAQRLGA